MWRRGRDSNPRYLAVHSISNAAQSATLSPLHCATCKELKCQDSLVASTIKKNLFYSKSLAELCLAITLLFRFACFPESLRKQK